MSFMRTLRTIRYLRARQIVGQVVHRIRPKLESPARFAAQRIPDWPGVRWLPAGPFLAPGGTRHSAADVLTGSLTFVNETHRAGWPPRWDMTGASALWQYNLHYFDTLWALDYEQARAMVRDWIENHPLAAGQIGWSPYPISVRLVNWCAVFFGRDRARLDADFHFRNQLWASIYLQAQWLRKHLEVHLLGNHFFENGVGLAFAGSCFDGPDADRWYRAGSGILTFEIREQVPADGMHFELSPMYHSRILYGLAMLANTGDPGLTDLVAEPVERMARALEVVRHPDGKIALLNDSAIGVYNDPGELLGYIDRSPKRARPEEKDRTGTGRQAARGTPKKADGPNENRSGTGRQVPTSRRDGTLERDDLPGGAFALRGAGYYGWIGDGGDYLVCDAGPIGPEYIPGHAHGDIFSFELSLGGQRIVVDSGVYDYVASEMREYCRSTRAHNTIEIDGQDQCELWDVFRVARRGRARSVQFDATERGFRLGGWHDGYQRMHGRPAHARRMVWDASGVLMIRDMVKAGREVSVAGRIHLHPDCRVDLASDNAATVATPVGAVRVAVAGGQLSVEDCWYCEQFGRRQANRAIVLTSTGSLVETAWCIARTDGPVTVDLDEGADVDGRRYSW